MTASLIADSRERWHGTIGGYNNHGCRCPECKTAKKEYLHTYRQARSDRLDAFATVAGIILAAWDDGGEWILPEFEAALDALRELVAGP